MTGWRKELPYAVCQESTVYFDVANSILFFDSISEQLKGILKWKTYSNLNFLNILLAPLYGYVPINLRIQSNLNKNVKRISDRLADTVTYILEDSDLFSIKIYPKSRIRNPFNNPVMDP